MSTTQPAESEQPVQLPMPPEFPITWEQSGDELRFWTTDAMHFPDPLAPLDDAVLRHLYNHGFARAAEAYDIPVRFHARRFNTYHYMTVAPLPLPHEELDAMGQRSEQQLGAAMGRLLASWNEVYLPEVQRDIERSAAINYDAASTEQLREHLHEAINRVDRQWEIHFLLAFPMLVAPSLFEEVYRELFGDQDALQAYRLLQGLDNLTVQMGRALWRLSRVALESSEVKHAIEQQAPDDVVGTLKQSDEGWRFIAALDGFLSEYGHRSTSLGVTGTTWIEDPTPVIRILKDYVARPDHDPDAELAALAAERERLVAEARERLSGYPEQVRGQFEFLLKAAQEATIVGEDHGFWIDFRALYELRRVLLAAGNRLAHLGVTSQRDDVFYLTFEELDAALASPSSANLSADIAARKAEIEHFRQITPPPAVGTLPPGPPPDNPIARALGKFFGAPPQPSDEPNLLRGAAGSAGVARGTVRILRSLSEAERLRPGDILVTQTTTPPWTPLFGAAGAVVTDTGGVLSHCAVVAREYGIPAVVGVGVATTMLRDGQEVEVDGSAGTVRIL